MKIYEVKGNLQGCWSTLGLWDCYRPKMRESVKKIRGKCGVKLTGKSCDLWKRKPATPASAQQGASQRKHCPHALPPSVPADDDPIGWTQLDIKGRRRLVDKGPRGSEQGMPHRRNESWPPKEAIQPIYPISSSTSTLVVFPMKTMWPQ